MKNPPNVLIIFLSNIVNAFLLAYIFNWWAGIRTARAGAQAGFIIFAITSLAFDLMMYATMNLLTPVVMVVDVVGSGEFGAGTGAVVGLFPVHERKWRKDQGSVSIRAAASSVGHRGEVG